MPRQKPIRMIPIKWPHLSQTIQDMASSRGRRREEYLGFVAEKLELIESARLAVVTFSVQPPGSGRSVHGHGPCRRAIVLFPFDKVINDAITSKLASILIGFDGFAKGWVFGAHTDAMAENIINVLLKHFEILILEENGKFAAVYK